MRLLNHTTLAVAVALALVAGAAATLLTTARPDKVITAYFAAAPALYPGDSVRVLGVEIGEIVSITAERDRVKVVLRYDPAIRVPEGASAAIVAPTMVSGRFVQLAPAYTTGPALPDDATIPQSRTATPVEWDTTVTELTELATQLGPASSELTGPLGRALDTVAANVDGQGDQLHDTIRNASAAMTTLADGGEDLFGTVRNLQSVVTNLARNDAAVDAFGRQLTEVADLLADNRDQLAGVLQTLDQVASLVATFVRDNRDQLSTDLTGLAEVARQVADNRQALADLLQRAPVAVSNLNNDYDPVGSLQPGAFALTNFSDPATFVCSLIFAAGGRNDNTNSACEAVIAPFVQVLRMNNVPLLVDPLQTAGGGR
ncbi:MCE family protein [Actinophytocola oryzae]|uniref:Phospholipid/cholesterol/gamma-HCH transport system substrate-binding protein n=1 Tax=Actinophytocola oryzae TaxID=502181 RepID=A0A4R7VYV1_9PSEU|nr:MCE family protein [Actinophytocola oryzae]TDV55356.1 phospholipid/cholesterol/gamma-HCH transport system substrate-binding protein [Actinophytocola oryzae]